MHYHPQNNSKLLWPSKTTAVRHTNTTKPNRTHNTDEQPLFFHPHPKTHFHKFVMFSFHFPPFCQPIPEPHLPPPDCHRTLFKAPVQRPVAQNWVLSNISSRGNMGVPADRTMRSHFPSPLPPSPTPVSAHRPAKKCRRIHASGRMGATRCWLLFVCYLTVCCGCCGPHSHAIHLDELVLQQYRRVHARP